MVIDPVTDQAIKKNRKYFRQVLYVRVGTVLIALLFGIPFLANGTTEGFVFGLLILAGCVAVFVEQLVSRPTDDDIDRQVHSVLGKLNEVGLQKLNLDESEINLIKPVIVGGYQLIPDLTRQGLLEHSRRNALSKLIRDNSPKKLIRKGKDGKHRSNIWEGVAIFFSAQELHYYKYQFDLVSKSQTDWTDVYFYRDVVSVSTRTSTARVTLVGRKKNEEVPTEVLTLTTSGGTAVNCSIHDQNDGSGHRIQAARQLIRDKKLNAI